jgi:hypothetical protein
MEIDVEHEEDILPQRTKGVSQLMFSTQPKYSFFYVFYLVLYTIVLLGSVFLIIYAISRLVHGGPMLLSETITAIVVDSILLFFIILRLPVRYQVWSDHFSCTTLDNYLPILPKFFIRILSRGYTVHFSRIDRIVFYDSPTDYRRTACHSGLFVILPNTWTSFSVPIKLYISREYYWKNFLLTPMFPRQLAAQLKRCLSDYRTEIGYKEPTDQKRLVDYSDEDEEQDPLESRENAAQVSFAAK